MTTPGPGSATPPAAPLADRVFEASVAAMEVLSIYLGDRLGWYRELAATGPLTSTELADRTGTQERYAREWLEQQATAGFLRVAADAADPRDRRFALDAEGVTVFTDVTSTDHLAPLARLFAASAVQLPALVAAYRDGGGVSWAQLGEDARSGQGDGNRPWFEQVLPGALAGVGHLHDALGRPGVRVADVGCGHGWATVALGRAYPEAQVVGVDVDAPSVARARENAAGLANVEVVHGGGEGLAGGPYDVVFLFECLHDMPYPVEVLAGVRSALAPGGRVVVMDEAAADELTAPGDLVERLLYGFSTLCCLPDGLSHPDSAGTGTVIRRSTVTRYAREAGFADVAVLPIEDFGFWRFYELT